jgi:TPR repeat protein
LSRMVKILSASLLIAALPFGILQLYGQTRGTTLQATSTPAGGDTGRYFALVIGIDKYPAPIPPLHTAVRDAGAMEAVLKQKYGFQTTLLTDANATRTKILDQIATYESQLGENDNLLIYYAGHGFQIKEADKSFWLPVDATSPQSANRISADDLTTEMATLKARHVLVISDSCYSGGLTRDIESLPVMRPDEAFLRKTLSMRSRNLMASGRDEPVADGGPDGHSVFAWAMLQGLNGETESLFTASTLFYDHVQRTVAGNSGQIPVYQPIRNSGDIGGDFVFRRAGVTGAQTQTLLAATPVGVDRGLAYSSSGDFNHAAPILTEGCSKNDPRSCSQLAYLYQNGKGVPQDYGQAVSLYRKACDGGSAGACTSLGSIYRRAVGVAADYPLALSLFRKGCDGGNITGCSDVAFMYENGYAVAQDYGQAVSIYGKACRDGDGLGCNNLGLMYQAGRGTAQDFGQALSLYSKACDAGNAIGCNNLGILYENGRGAAPDFGQAVSQYRKACDGGNDFGCSNLGRMYENGRGVARDLVQADDFYEKGCKAGAPRACRFLANNLEKGLGRPKNLTGASNYLQMACRLGDTSSCAEAQRLGAAR